MTVLVHIGRRVPKSWFKRTASKVKGLVTFQENIWIMIKQSMQLAKKKANQDGRLKFTMFYDNEAEDKFYNIEWMKIVIQGKENLEEEEYNEAMGMYSKLGDSLKKEMPKDDRIGSVFKSKYLGREKIEKAYKEGYGSTKDKSIASKLLEMGILTHIEWVKDFEYREKDPKFDF